MANVNRKSAQDISDPQMVNSAIYKIKCLQNKKDPEQFLEFLCSFICYSSALHQFFQARFAFKSDARVFSHIYRKKKVFAPDEDV